MTPFIWRIVARAYPYGSWKKYIAVLEFETYCDESGIHDGARVCIVAGYFGSARQWDRFHKLWEPHARNPGFHAKSFFARDPRGRRVSPYKGWTDAQANAYLDALLNAITHVSIYPVGGIVDVEAFMKCTEDERAHLTGSDRLIAKKQTVTGAPTRPYFLGFQEAIANSLHRLKRSDSQVHFTFDQQKAFASLALEMYQYFKRIEPRWAPKMGDARFSTRADAIGLQAADLLAHCWYQYVLNKRNVHPEVHRVLIRQKVRRLTWFNTEQLDILLKKVRAS